MVRATYCRVWVWLLMLASMVAPAGLAASTSEPVSTEAVISDVPPLKLTNVTHLFDIKHDFRQPSDLAVSKAGHIYVVDGVNNSIKVFGKKGDFLFAFGKKGRGPGEFNYPLGITLDGAGQVYIADSGNQRVQVFSAGGEFLYQIELPAKDGKLADPTDVAVMADGSQCFVVDNDHHYILVYDLAGRKLINTFGGPGIDKWEFRYPFQLSLYKEKYLYIVDVINTRVQVLTTEGKFFTFIGEWGVERGEFFRPKGVAVDHTGHAFVSDSYMGVVQVFDGGTGAFRSVVGDGETGGVKRFKTPVGLFIDHNDRLYVVEMFAEKISVYQIERSE